MSDDKKGPWKHIIINDEMLIIKFGADMLENLSHIPENKPNSKKVERASETNDSCKATGWRYKFFKQFDKTVKYETFVIETKILAGVGPKTYELKTPKLAKPIGESIQKRSAIERKIAITIGKETRWLHYALFDLDWNVKITTKVLATLI